MDSKFVALVPVLPSSDIARDVEWYQAKLGFEKVFADSIYAAIRRGPIWLHLQWHADTPEDPLLGGSVVRIFVTNIRPMFDEFVRRRTVTPDALRERTPWATTEFGVRDQNNNTIFFVEDLDSCESQPS